MRNKIVSLFHFKIDHLLQLTTNLLNKISILLDEQDIKLFVLKIRDVGVAEVDIM